MEERIQQHLLQRIELNYNKAVASVCLNNKDTRFHFAGRCTENSIFEIGSITQCLTAHLCFILEQKGVLSLDDPIPPSLPCLRKKPSGITFRHLLTHTSGFTDPKGDYYYNPVNGNTFPLADYKEQDLNDHLSTLIKDPEKKATYAHLNYAVLGHTLESLTKKSYEELLKTLILDPLGMHSTFAIVPPGYTGYLIKGTSNGEDAPYLETQFFPAYGGLKSTIRDLSIYARYLFLHKSQILDNIRRIFFDSNALINFDEDEISMNILGWKIDKRNNGTIYTASGSTLGFSSFIGYSPLKKSCAVLLADSNTMGTLGHYMLNPSFQLPCLHKEISLSVQSLELFCGQYYQENDEAAFLISFNKGCLCLKGHNGKSMRMYPKSKNVFFLKYLDDITGFLKFTFFQDRIEAKIDGIPFTYYLKI